MKGLPVGRGQLPGVQVVEMPVLQIRAAVEPKTLNEAERTVELVFSTGAPVERYDWATGKRYLEVLSLDPAHVKLDRLNGGGPLLDSHSAWSVADQLGAVVPGSVRLSKKEARATVRFSRRQEVEGVWQDVRDGLINSVSVGYRTYRFEESAPKGNELPVRTSTSWEPFEISMVAIPADPGSKTRESKAVETNQCEARTADSAAAAPALEVLTMKPPTPANPNASEFLDTRAADDVPPAPPQPVAEPSERAEGAAAERTRVQDIMAACRAARLPQSFADKLIADAVPTLDAQRRVFEELSKRDNATAGPARTPASSREVIVGDDPFVHRRSGLENALLHRVAPHVFKLEDHGREYRGLGLLDMARIFLNARGVRTSQMSKLELAGAALGLDTRGGMHTTSDFALLLADVANKTLRAAYDAAPQTWLPISRRVVLNDFKPSKQLSMGDAPALLQVLEHGEFKRGTIAEAKEEFYLKTYGRVFAITRTALINDDTDAFSRVPMLFGRAARNLESDLVWALITANAAMADGNAIFSVAHANLAGAAAAISVDSIGIGRAAMRTQKGLDGVTLLNVTPRHLIVPAAKETLAEQICSSLLVANQASAVNPFAGKLTPLAEPRLDGNSTTAWYLATNPQECDMVLYGTLDGQEGPAVESRLGFDVDGLEVKCRHDFAATVVDHRGLFKNAGA